jgi:hypothetical protein
MVDVRLAVRLGSTRNLSSHRPGVQTQPMDHLRGLRDANQLGHSVEARLKPCRASSSNTTTLALIYLLA